jgi:hypothetical protein
VVDDLFLGCRMVDIILEPFCVFSGSLARLSSSLKSHSHCFAGNCWDVRGIAGIEGYRAVLTLELSVDANQVGLGAMLLCLPSWFLFFVNVIDSAN